MALTLKQLKMTPKRTELLEKMGLRDSDAILMCVPLRYQSREVIPYDQWQVKSEVILEGQIVRPATRFSVPSFIACSTSFFFAEGSDEQSTSILIGRPAKSFFKETAC